MSDRSEEMGRLAAREQQNEDEDEEEVEQEQEESESADATAGEDTGESSAERAPINVKDREETLFAYIPDMLNRQVEAACSSISSTYHLETGEKLGKNRYLYPIVLMVGADNAVDLSAEEIRDLVERIDDVEDAS